MKDQSGTKKQESIETALINEVASDNLKDIFIEGAEVSLDQFLADGVLKRDPIFWNFI